MRAVTGELTSSNPLSLSKAAAIISRFASSDTGARPDVAAYLRRTCSAFDELVDVHREIRAHCKRSHFELKENATHEEDNDQLKKTKEKKKKKKGNYNEEGEGNSILELKEEIKQSSMRKDERLQEVDGVDFVSENKKRKRSHADEGEANGGMEQHERKKKSKRRIFE